MAVKVPMPKFGLSMEEGTIAEWLVKEGDYISKGQAIAEVNSEKLTNNAESEFEGTLLKILVEVDDTVECGTPIAIIGEAGEDISALLGGEAAPAPAPAPEAAPAAPADPAKAAADANVKLVPMPKFGLSMEEGTIAEWLVKEGDHISKGQAIAEVNSEKLTNNAESEFEGTLLKILVDVDETVECGTPIAILGEPGTDISAFTGGAPAAAPAPEAAPAAPAAAPAPAPAAPVNVNITPRAKKYAEEKGLSYAHIKGTGIGGAITIDDVKKNGVSKDAPAKDPADVNITPRAKKYAEENNLLYAHITGTGIGGAITIADVKANGIPATKAEPAAPAAAPAAPAPAAVPAAAPKASGAAPQVAATVQDGDQIIKMSSMQQTICKAMYNSVHGTAQARIMTEINVENLTKLYKQLKPKYSAVGVKLSYTAFIVKAVAMALENHEAVRTQYVDDKHIKITNKIDIGVAVDVPNGLVVPVIRDANLKDLRQICIDLSDIVDRAKNNKLTSDDFGGGITSITNLGMYNVTYTTPVLNGAEPTILGCGSIFEKPVIKNGGIFIEHVMNLTITHDHRISNGGPVARYLKEVSDNLSDFKWA